MKKYTVLYKTHSASEVFEKVVNANSAYDAWAAVAFTKVDGEIPYSAWVDLVEYKNGRIHYFNTYEGNPY